VIAREGHSISPSPQPSPSSGEGAKAKAFTPVEFLVVIGIIGIIGIIAALITPNMLRQTIFYLANQ
jgi:hypothetical protein